VACYGLVALAAVVRVAVPLIAPSLLYHAVIVASLLWSGGFGLYTVRYWPILSRARPDGHAG
jgi:uncharacterized protein involved in response to NO